MTSIRPKLFQNMVRAPEKPLVDALLGTMGVKSDHAEPFLIDILPVLDIGVVVIGSVAPLPRFVMHRPGVRQVLIGFPPLVIPFKNCAPQAVADGLFGVSVTLDVQPLLFE